jgi:hypothetical protein
MSNDRIQAFLDNPKSYLAACAVTYEKRRDLRHVHDDRLNSRADDIIGNLWTTDACGTVTQLSEPTRREFFMRLYAELQEERRLRKGHQVIDFDEEAIRAEASGDYTAPRLTSATPTLAPSALVRFGKYAHVEGALTQGTFRIAPASNYADPSLNAAQFDEELRHHAVTPNQHLVFNLFGRRTPEGPEEELRVTPLELYRYMNVPPFYVLCLSSRFDFRMFHDFGADAALVIHDRKEFARRVNVAMALAVDAEPDMGNVQYYDPYQVLREELIPGFSKHFRYAYQTEVRMIWRPKSGTTPAAVFIKAGRLNDIAELVRTA